MEKLKDIRSFQDLKDLVLSNKDTLKKAALPLVVVVALVFLWGMGNKDQGKIKEEDNSAQNDQIASQEEDSDQEGEEKGNNVPIYVDISGCVKEPGVYTVDEGTRLFQLIELAGGLTEGADIENINRAEEVCDGQKIVIYAVGDETGQSISQGSGSGSGSSSSSSSSGQSSSKVNINKADSSQLQTVPGIGPATAQKIIEYRETNGRFSKLEDIKNVSGIGDKTFESMKEYITV